MGRLKSLSSSASPTGLRRKRRSSPPPPVRDHITVVTAAPSSDSVAQGVPREYQEAISAVYRDLSLYEILNVDRKASLTEIRIAFFQKGRANLNEEEFTATRMAFEILSNPLWRKEYDSVGWGNGVSAAPLIVKESTLAERGRPEKSKEDKQSSHKAGKTDFSVIESKNDPTTSVADVEPKLDLPEPIDLFFGPGDLSWPADDNVWGYAGDKDQDSDDDDDDEKEKHSAQKVLTSAFRPSSGTTRATTLSVKWCDEVEELVYVQDQAEREYKCSPGWQEEEQMRVQAYMTGEDEEFNEEDYIENGSVFSGFLSDMEASLDGLESSLDNLVRFATQSPDGEDHDEEGNDDDENKREVVVEPPVAFVHREESGGSSTADISDDVPEDEQRVFVQKSGPNSSSEPTLPGPLQTSPTDESDEVDNALPIVTPRSESVPRNDTEEPKKDPDPELYKEDWADNLFQHFMRPPPAVEQPAGTAEIRNHRKKMTVSTQLESAENIKESIEGNRSPSTIGDEFSLEKDVPTPTAVSSEESEEGLGPLSVVDISTCTVDQEDMKHAYKKEGVSVPRRLADLGRRRSRRIPSETISENEVKFPAFVEEDETAWDKDSVPVSSVERSPPNMDANVSIMSDLNTISTAEIVPGPCARAAAIFLIQGGQGTESRSASRVTTDVNDSLSVSDDTVLSNAVGYMQSLCLGCGDTIRNLNVRDALGIEESVGGMLNVMSSEMPSPTDHEGSAKQ